MRNKKVLGQIQVILEGRCVECLEFNPDHTYQCSAHPMRELFDAFDAFNRVYAEWQHLDGTSNAAITIKSVLYNSTNSFVEL